MTVHYSLAANYQNFLCENIYYNLLQLLCALILTLCLKALVPLELLHYMIKSFYCSDAPMEHVFQ